MIEFKHACPIGNYCFSSAILNFLEIRDKALPFDWLFTTPHYTSEIIKDDFKEFLNKEHYVDIHDAEEEHGGRQAGHSLYHKNCFNHKNPRDKEDYDYYVRCVERFREFLKMDEKKLFICSYKNTFKTIDEIKSEIDELHKILSQKTKNFHILCHANYPYHMNVRSVITEVDNITFFELYSRGDNHGLGYGVPEDSLEFYKTFNSLFKQVK
tara:strand:+ start:389 stop:1021 length:633 start_codon:yes stop_codon:yes gene_type:complete